MPTFVVIAHTATTDPSFSLDDLAGGAGRLDVLCRCVNAAFFLSHDLRRDVRLHLVIRGDVTLTLEGSSLRRVAPDERNIASHLRSGLAAAGEAVGHQSVESGPGIHASRLTLEEVLADVDGAIVRLHEGGGAITEREPSPGSTFVLSDHRDVTSDEERFLREAVDERVSVGPRPLHADHAITIAHNYLDTEGFRRY